MLPFSHSRPVPTLGLRHRLYSLSLAGISLHPKLPEKSQIQWGPKCDKHLFPITTKPPPPVIPLAVEPGLTPLTERMLQTEAGTAGAKVLRLAGT